MNSWQVIKLAICGDAPRIHDVLDAALIWRALERAGFLTDAPEAGASLASDTDIPRDLRSVI